MVRQKAAHILVVDDEADIREMLSRHFRFEGYEVLEAGNGIEALSILKKKRIEVVITDINMPKMTGVELLKRLKNEYPMVQPIVITGHVTMENLLAALKHGAATCVFKPLDDMKELEDAVKRAVDHLKMWQNKLKELQSMKV